MDVIRHPISEVNTSNEEINNTIILNMLNGYFSTQQDVDYREHLTFISNVLPDGFSRLLDKGPFGNFIGNFLHQRLCVYIETILARIVYFKVETIKISKLYHKDMSTRPRRNTEIFSNIYEFLAYLIDTSKTTSSIRSHKYNQLDFTQLKNMFHYGTFVINRCKPVILEYIQIFIQSHHKHIGHRKDLIYDICEQFLEYLKIDQVSVRVPMSIDNITDRLMLSSNRDEEYHFLYLILIEPHIDESFTYLKEIKDNTVQFINTLIYIGIDIFENDFFVINSYDPGRVRQLHPGFYNHHSGCAHINIFIFNAIKSFIRQFIIDHNIQYDVVDVYLQNSSNNDLTDRDILLLKQKLSLSGYINVLNDFTHGFGIAKFTFEMFKSIYSVDLYLQSLLPSVIE